jgi:DNA-binding XRE family transcriptional regulator
MPPRKLDNYIRMFRKRAGLFQEEVSFLLGTKRETHVSRWELGRRDPSLETALALSAILSVPVEELFRGRFEKVKDAVTERARLLAAEIEKDGLRERTLRSLAAIIGTTENYYD